MRKTKILLLSLFLALVTANASAEITPSYTSIEYGDKVTFTIDSDSYSSVGGAKIELCGVEKSAEGTYAGVNLPVDITVHVPNYATCSQGEYDVNAYIYTIEGETIDAGTATLQVDTAGFQAAHNGDYLYVKMNPGKPKLYSFFLSDDEWSHTSGAPGGLMIEQVKDGLFGKSYSQCAYQINPEMTTVGPLEGELNDWFWVELDGDCGDRTTDVLEQPFGNMNQGMDAYLYNGVDVSPVHAEGDYKVDDNGQLARAYEPNIDGYSGLNGQGPQWYICREGATGTSGNGKVISLSQYEGGELLKCDLQGNGEGWRDNTRYDWDPVTECQDGLDNNDKNGIDLEDPACNGESSTEIEGDVQCKPVVDTSPDVAGKAAFYDASGDQYSVDNSDCTYGSVDNIPPYTNEPAELFYCAPTGGTSEYDGPTPTAAETFCENYVNTNGITELMPVVQYFIPKVAMPAGSNRWAQKSTDYQDGGFVSNYKFEHLHQAELSYGSSSAPHSAQIWEEHNVKNQSYEDHEYHTDFLDSWNVSNATGRYNEDIHYPFGGTLDQDDVFDGGFYGECTVSSMQWIYSLGEWVCDFGSAGKEIIKINSYRLNGDLGGKLAGFQVNWSEMQKWEGAHPAAPPAGSDDGYVGAVDVEAMCWQGAQTERPQDLSKVVNLTAGVSEGQTTYVVGELPARSSVNNPEKYTCVFGFSQLVPPNKHPISPQTQLFYRGEEGLCYDCRFIEGYITEGTNDAIKGNIFIEDQRIRPSENMQNWLSDKTTADTGNQLWKHFRTSAEVPQDNRNPWQECMNEGRCGVAGS